MRLRTSLFRLNKKYQKRFKTTVYSSVNQPHISISDRKDYHINFLQNQLQEQRMHIEILQKEIQCSKKSTVGDTKNKRHNTNKSMKSTSSRLNTHVESKCTTEESLVTTQKGFGKKEQHDGDGRLCVEVGINTIQRSNLHTQSLFNILIHHQRIYEDRMSQTVQYVEKESSMRHQYETEIQKEKMENQKLKKNIFQLASEANNLNKYNRKLKQDIEKLQKELRPKGNYMLQKYTVYRQGYCQKTKERCIQTDCDSNDFNKLSNLQTQLMSLKEQNTENNKEINSLRTSLNEKQMQIKDMENQSSLICEEQVKSQIQVLSLKLVEQFEDQKNKSLKQIMEEKNFYYSKYFQIYEQLNKVISESEKEIVSLKDQIQERNQRLQTLTEQHTTMQYQYNYKLNQLKQELTQDKKTIQHLNVSLQDQLWKITTLTDKIYLLQKSKINANSPRVSSSRKLSKSSLSEEDFIQQKSQPMLILIEQHTKSECIQKSRQNSLSNNDMQKDQQKGTCNNLGQSLQQLNWQSNYTVNNGDSISQMQDQQQS